MFLVFFGNPIPGVVLNRRRVERLQNSHFAMFVNLLNSPYRSVRYSSQFLYDLPVKSLLPWRNHRIISREALELTRSSLLREILFKSPAAVIPSTNPGYPVVIVTLTWKSSCCLHMTSCNIANPINLMENTLLLLTVCYKAAFLVI